MPVPAAPLEMPITIAAPAHGPNGAVTRVVLHDEEFNVGPNSAELIAQFFTNNGGVAAHYVVDSDSVQHCVPENQIAWHAPPNEHSIGIEHDGYASFTSANWDSPGSRATLARSAQLTAGICLRWDIPVVFLHAADLVADPFARGITTHNEVSLAFGQSDHHDPGPNFPIDAYLTAVASTIARLTPSTTTLLDMEDSMEKIVIDAPGRPKALLAEEKGQPLARIFSPDEWQAYWRLFYDGGDITKPRDPKHTIKLVNRPVAEYDALTGFKSGA